VVLCHIGLLNDQEKLVYLYAEKNGMCIGKEKDKKVNVHENRVVDVVDISTDMFAESMHVEKNDAGWPETLRIACV